MTIPVVIAGAAGRMGRMLVRHLHDRAVPGLALKAAVDRADLPECGQDAGTLAGVGPLGIPLTADLAAAMNGARVMVDFSFHTATAENARRAAEHGLPLVIGTTGLADDEKAIVNNAAARIPVVMAPNMSLGVNLLMCLVRDAARALSGKGYDIEIVERHHRRKLDAPSGTALGLGEAAAEGLGWRLADVAVHGRAGVAPGDRPATQIGFHAVRGGDIVGDHTVLFAAEGECIELSHRATSRSTFAVGALRAAAWIVGRPAGLYTMRDVLGL